MTTTPYPLGHPDNERTRRAALDAVLLTQAIHRDDTDAQVAVLANCDPFSICAQLSGFLLATMRQYNVDIDERLDIWRAVTATQAGGDRPVTAIPGVGAQYPQPDRRGWLVFDALPPDLQRAEDSTQHADYARSGGNGARLQFDRDARVWYFERDATHAERTLLTHLGYTLPDVLKTRVDYATETLRRRTWPQLETQEIPTP